MKTTADWYYYSGNEAVGPIDFSSLTDLIVKRELVRTSMVWKVGMEKWMPLESMHALAAFLPKNETRLNLSAGTAQPATPHEPAGVAKPQTVENMLQHAHGVQPRHGSKSSQDKRSFVKTEPEYTQNALLQFYCNRSFAGKWVIWFTAITAIGALIASFFDESLAYQSKNNAPHPSAIWWALSSMLNFLGAIAYALYCRFKNGPLWGIACIFIPGVWLVYLIKFWHDCWRSDAVYNFFILNILAACIAAAPVSFFEIFRQ